MRRTARRAAPGIGLVVGLAAVLALGGCVSRSGPPPTGGTVPPTATASPVPGSVPVAPGEPFTLAPGQTARLVGGGSRLAVTFVEVRADGRCPTSVQCVWAGDATVRIRVAGPATGIRDLHTHPSFPRSAVVAGHEIRLVALAPERVGTDPVPPGRYRATLTIS